MIICFREKYGDRYIEGPDQNSILTHMLRDRIAETYRVAFGVEDDTSIWYGDETARAQEMLDKGRAVQYMTERQYHEYENWFVVNVETVE